MCVIMDGPDDGQIINSVVHPREVVMVSMSNSCKYSLFVLDADTNPAPVCILVSSF